MIGSDSYRCDARHRVDERKQKISQSRMRSVRVRWFAKTAIEGQRAGFPLLRTRARACGVLPYLTNTKPGISTRRSRLNFFQELVVQNDADSVKDNSDR